MLEVALLQVEMRLPETKSVFENLRLLSPTHVLSQSKPLFGDLPFPHLKSEVAEQEYRRVHLIEWDCETIFFKGVPKDSISFWEGVGTVNNFKNVASYALNCLIVPSSNAVIERVFSLVTATKTKTRNKLSVNTLDAIVRIKSHFHAREKCCNKFKVTDAMIEKHQAATLYYWRFKDKEDDQPEQRALLPTMLE